MCIRSSAAGTPKSSLNADIRHAGYINPSAAMPFRLAVAVALFGISLLAVGQSTSPYRERGWCSYNYPSDRPVPVRLNLPDWACRETFNRGLQTRFTPDTLRNPFYLSGDFDGDGRTDIAIWVRSAKSSKRGLLILTRGGAYSFVAAAGTGSDERGDDYAGLDMWTVVPKGEVLDSPYEPQRVVLRGDGISLGKSESATFVIYWDGKKFAYYQTVD
jgi:hypothetical protein